MSTNLFYFSATGNSLMACKELQRRITECSLESMVKIEDKKVINTDSGTVGFIFPLYFGGMPNMVASFISKVNFTNIDYIFVVVTKSQFPSPSIVGEQMNQILKRYSKSVNAVFYLEMVGNFIKKYDILDIEAQHAAIDNALKKIDLIAESVQGKGNVIENPVPLLNFLGRRVYRTWKKNFHRNDSGFFSKKCNSCGLCEKICPTNNILLADTGPTWNHTCELCFACIHVCPLKEIQYGKNTLNRQRYMNPNISINELLAR